MSITDDTDEAMDTVDEQDVDKHPGLSGKERYDLAVPLVKAEKFDEAIDLLSRACELYSAEHGEDSILIAPVFYLYGSALLGSYQAKSSVLGSVEKKGSDEQKPAAATASAATAEGDEPLMAPPEDAPQADEEDLEVAFETLEIARVLYVRGYQALGGPENVATSAATAALPAEQRQQQAELAQKLADVHQRIADLFMEQEVSTEQRQHLVAFCQPAD